MDNINEKKNKNNFERALGALKGDNRLPPIPCGSVMKDTDEKKKKRSDRNLKYKPKYSKDSE